MESTLAIIDLTDHQAEENHNTVHLKAKQLQRQNSSILENLQKILP
jgi:hypothetical protein